MKLQTGFSLIEVMVAVAIVAILAAVAVPSYTDFVLRGNIPEATAGLASQRVQMEQFFQDNRTYAGGPGCAADIAGKYFDFKANGSCAATAYTITAAGKSKMAGFNYTINESNAKTSPFSGAPSGWSAHSPDNCWVTAKGGAC